MLSTGARLLRSAPVLGAAFMLQGCLVAAVPVVAGGLMAGRDVVKEARRDGETMQPPAGEVTVARSTQPETTQAIAAPANPVAPQGVDVEGDASGEVWRVTQLGALPAPGSTPRPANSIEAQAFSSFTSYAAKQAGLPDSKTQSATLANPAALDAKRAPCIGLPDAVLIDLDPDGGLVATEGSAQADPAFASALEQLRRQEVTVGWISGRLMLDAERIRARLAASGLDPLGEDTLLLPQTFGARKQELRRQFGRDYCLVAIAGDTKSDFDELFDYLKSPDAAVTLDVMDGAGWFITPPPLRATPLTTE